MSTIPTLARLLALSGLAALSARGAFIIETNGTRGNANFSYTGGAGGAARASTTSAGNLPAVAEGTFFTLGHVYGGTVVPHQYTFTYSPGTDVDNTAFALGTQYNLQQGLSSSGQAGGIPGIYNVYRIAPANPGVTIDNTTLYELFVNGGLASSQTVDQSVANIATGEGVGRWELVGSVSLSNATDTVSVTMTPSTDGFVSMRASGIMFEYVSAIPEPASITMLGLGLAMLGLRRRR